MCRCKDATALEAKGEGEEPSLKAADGVRLVKGCGMPGP